MWRGVEAYEQFHLLCALPFTTLLEFSSCELYNQGKKRLFKKQTTTITPAMTLLYLLKLRLYQSLYYLQWFAFPRQLWFRLSLSSGRTHPPAGPPRCHKNSVFWCHFPHIPMHYFYPRHLIWWHFKNV